MVHVKDLNLNLLCGGKNSYGDDQSYIHCINQVPPSVQDNIIKCKTKSTTSWSHKLEKLSMNQIGSEFRYFPFPIFDLSIYQKYKKQAVISFCKEILCDIMKKIALI